MNQSEYIQLMQYPSEFNELRAKEGYGEIIIKDVIGLTISNCNLKGVTFVNCDSGHWKYCSSGQWESCNSGQWKSCDSGQWKSCGSGQWKSCYSGQAMYCDDMKLVKSYILVSWCRNIVKTDCPDNDVDAYIQHWNLETDGNKVKMYKTVRDNDTDFYSGTIHYKDGETITCPDWDNNYYGECGKGIHLCPNLEEARKYNKGKGKSFWVDKEDIRVYPRDLSKVRVRKVEVIGDV